MSGTRSSGSSHPPTRVVVLIISLSCHCKPLCRVWEFHGLLDLGLLFDQPVALEDLNDDGFARSLDRLHASGELRRLPLGVRSVHVDTTSIILQGEFASTESGRDFERERLDRPLLNISHGYCRDHRPDLKQFI